MAEQSTIHDNYSEILSQSEAISKKIALSMSKGKITNVEILRHVNEINQMQLDLVKLIGTMMGEHKQFTDELR